MNLNAAAYLLGWLAKRRLNGVIVTTFDEDGPDFNVTVRLNDGGEIDVGELGTACHLLGYRMLLRDAGMVVFEAGRHLLPPPPEVDVEVDEVTVDAVDEEEMRYRHWRSQTIRETGLVPPDGVGPTDDWEPGMPVASRYTQMRYR